MPDGSSADMPQPGWRPSDTRSAAPRRGQARAKARREGKPEPVMDVADMVSPVEGTALHQGPADGEVYPDSEVQTHAEKPWHQRPDETHEAYHCFWTYVNMGTGRSLMEVCRKERKAKSIVQGWSSRHHWRMRLFRYMMEQDRIRQQNYRQELADMSERHAKFARAMSGKIIKRLQTMDVEELTPKDMAHWFKITTELERQALDADRLRRPEMTTRSVRRQDVLARSWARAVREDDPDNFDHLGDGNEI